MNNGSPVAVALPRTDAPASADAGTQFSLSYLRLTGLSPLLFTVALVLFSLRGLIFDTGLWTTWVLVFLAVTMVFLAVRWAWLIGRWLPKAKRLLNEQSWRAVSATMQRYGSTYFVVEVQDQNQIYQIKVTEILGKISRYVVHSTGRVWLVGPDQAGWCAVRLDGSVFTLPARKIPANSVSAQQQLPAQVDDTPVIQRWAKLLALRATIILRTFVFGGLSGVVLGIWLMVMQDFEPIAVSVGMIFIVTIVAIFLSVYLILSRQFRFWRKLPKLIEAGPWQQIFVALDPWRVPLSGQRDARGFIRQQHGPELAIHIPKASIDLVTNMQATGMLWVAGTIVPGQPAAVGFPGYPVVGYANFSPV